MKWTSRDRRSSRATTTGHLRLRASRMAAASPGRLVKGAAPRRRVRVAGGDPQAVLGGEFGQRAALRVLAEAALVLAFGRDADVGDDLFHDGKRYKPLLAGKQRSLPSNRRLICFRKERISPEMSVRSVETDERYAFRPPRRRTHRPAEHQRLAEQHPDQRASARNAAIGGGAPLIFDPAAIEPASPGWKKSQQDLDKSQPQAQAAQCAPAGPTASMDAVVASPAIVP